MKAIKLPLTILTIAIGITSCCTKKDCAGANEIIRFEFNNFSEDELYYCKLYAYELNTGFAQAVDTILVTPQEVNGTWVFDTWRGVFYDYKLEVDSAAYTYYINDFDTREEKCGTCPGAHNMYSVLSGYAINGVNYNGGAVVVSK